MEERESENMHIDAGVGDNVCMKLQASLMAESSAWKTVQSGGRDQASEWKLVSLYLRKTVKPAPVFPSILDPSVKHEMSASDRPELVNVAMK